MNAVELRTARADDAALLSVLAIHVFVQAYATEGVDGLVARDALKSFSIDVWRDAIARADAEIIVAQRAGGVIGFACLTHRASNPCVPFDEAAELDHLYVQERFARQGVGRALLAEAERRAGVGGARAVWLTAWVENARALRFYPARGYLDVGSWPYRFEGETFDNRVFLKRL